jgi:CheY-like chemotaxis protein
LKNLQRMNRGQNLDRGGWEEQVRRNIPGNVPMESEMKTKFSILIVDDVYAVRETLKVLLEPQFEVYTAADGNEALHMIQKRRFHLITLDLHMPRLSGIETLREIRKINKKVDVVIITGLATEAYQKEAFRYGVKAFIAKPFSTEEITMVIDEILGLPLASGCPS